MKRTLGPSTGAGTAALRARPGARDRAWNRALAQRARMSGGQCWVRTRRPLAHTAGRAA